MNMKLGLICMIYGVGQLFWYCITPNDNWFVRYLKLVIGVIAIAYSMTMKW